MRKVETLAHLGLDKEEKGMAASIINRFGEGQHPHAENSTINGFAVSYLKDIIKSDEFVEAKPKLSPIGIKALEGIETKIEEY